MKSQSYFDLRQRLAEAYPTTDMRRMAARDIGLDATRLQLEGVALTGWENILEAVSRRQLIDGLRALIVRDNDAALLALFEQCAAELAAVVAARVVVFSLEDIPFPIGNDDAKELRNLLADLYGSERPALGFVERFGIERRDIPLGLSASAFWNIVLDKLAESGRVRECVAAARAQYKDNPRVPFLDRLLAAPRRYERGPGAAAVGAEPADYDPCEYLGLFDRVVESRLLVQGLRALRTAPAPELRPIVVMLLSEHEDQYSYFLKQANADVVGPLLGDPQPEKYVWSTPEKYTWSTDPEVTNETEIYSIAKKKIDKPGNPLPDVLPRLGEALAGKPLYFSICSECLRNKAVEDKLEQFLALWGQLGARTLPNVLYVNIERRADVDLDLTTVKAKLSAMFGRLQAGLSAVSPLTLAVCQASDIDDWRDVLVENGRTIIRANYSALQTYFRPKPTFRLRELMQQLETTRIYT